MFLKHCSANCLISSFVILSMFLSTNKQKFYWISMATETSWRSFSVWVFQNRCEDFRLFPKQSFVLRKTDSAHEREKNMLDAVWSETKHTGKETKIMSWKARRKFKFVATDGDEKANLINCCRWWKASRQKYSIVWFKINLNVFLDCHQTSRSLITRYNSFYYNYNYKATLLIYGHRIFYSDSYPQTSNTFSNLNGDKNESFKRLYNLPSTYFRLGNNERPFKHLSEQESFLILFIHQEK